MKSMVLSILMTLILVFVGQLAFADNVQIPSACRACMSECPHVTRELRACDRGCPDVRSRAQAKAWKDQQSAKKGAKSCYECMSECPHNTRDLKDCDRGCPGTCDLEGMKKAFLKANEKAQGCGGSSQGSADSDAEEGLD